MSQAASDDDIGELGPSEYLLYHILLARDKQDDKETGRTNAHKLCVLADRKLREEYGRDVLLPSYWYKYGHMIYETELNTAVAHRPESDKTYGYSYYPAEQISETDFDHLDEDLKDDIFQVAQEIVDEHGDKTIEELEEYQYQNFRPDEFIEAYGDLRWHLAQFVVDKDQRTLTKYSAAEEKSVIEDYLDRMLATFPEDKFSDIYEVYLLWDDTIRLMYEQGYSPRSLKEFTELFIEGLAKSELRLRYHDHVPEERVAVWREEKDDEIDELAEKVRLRRKEALKHRSESGTLEKVANSYNETILNDIDEISNG